MAGNAPLVSVVMSIYNDGPFVKEAVSSILQQSFKDFEFIIIDDGSFDGSVNKVMEFDDPRIRLIRQENCGLASALNRGIAEARGRYIARQDGDDISEVNRLGLQVRHMENNPAVVVLGSNVSYMDEWGRILLISDFPLDNGSLQHRLLYGSNPFCHGSVMFRKAESFKVGLYRSKFAQAQDIDFFLRLAEQGDMANLPSAEYRWRLRRGSVGNAKRENQRDYARLAFLNALQRQRGESEAEINLRSVQRPFLRNFLSRLRRCNPEVEYEFNLAIFLFGFGKTVPAREYLRTVIRNESGNVYAWLLVFLTALPHPLGNYFCEWIRYYYHKLIWTNKS